MAHPGERTRGGRSNARPSRRPVAETRPGASDDAVGPEDRAIAELADLAHSPEGRRIEQKLRAEALARRLRDDEDSALDDPTGHA